MTFLKDPVVSSGDDLDNLLRAFFQAEMPNPWPAVEVPARRLQLAAPEEAPAPSRHSSLWRSRLALAASVALLVSGTLFLSSDRRETGANGGGPTIGPGKADLKDTPHYRSHENLLVTPDGVVIRVDIFEEPAKK